MYINTLIATTILAFTTLSLAHPGEHEHRNALADLQKRDFKANVRRGLDGCADKLARRGGVYARAEERRRATVDKIRKRRMIRDTDTILNTSHAATNGSVTLATSEAELFSSNSTCILNPEGETGPYWVKGEHVRSDLRDEQPGVPIILDGQFIDVETCEPITGLYWDIWNCNSTGVYSGLVATGNGNTDDTSNLNATFLRGVQETDSDGVVQFSSVFPGHYSWRTTHIHMVAHLNVSVLANNTITGGTVAHIGQLFWDQDLITKVEATYPYNTNNITITTNAEDRVFSDETETDSDPVLEYVMLGDTLADGLFAWVTVAVNVSATYDPNYSFVYTASGGVAESGGGTDSVDGGDSTGSAPSGSMSAGGSAPSGL